MALGSAIAAQLGAAEEVYTNEVQTVTITGTPTGGTFTLTFNGAVTAAIAYNAVAAAVQAALEALPNIGVGNVAAGGGPGPGTPYTVTFQGTLGGLNVAQMTATGSFTGGAAPAVAVTTTTPGTGYGDFVAPTRFNEFVDEGLKADVQDIFGKSIRAGNRVQRGDRRVKNEKGAGGPLTFEVLSKGFGIWFKHMFGAVAITTPSGATVARQQRFTIGDPKGKSLSVQKGVPDVNGTVRPIAFKGVKILDWELSCDVDGLLMLKVNTDSMQQDLATSLGVASYAAAMEELAFTGGLITVQGANTDIRTISIRGVVGYKTDRYFQRASSLKKEPIPIKLYALEGSIDAEFTDLALLNLFMNKTPAQIVAQWTGATQIDPGGTGYNSQVKVTMPQCIFKGETPSIPPEDIVRITLPFDINSDGTNEPITLDYITLDTAV